MQVLVRDNNVDQALKVLKKKLQREGVFRELKRKSFYEKPSERKAREKGEAVRRARKLARKKAQREGLIAAPKRKLPLRGARPGMLPSTRELGRSRAHRLTAWARHSEGPHKVAYSGPGMASASFRPAFCSRKNMNSPAPMMIAAPASVAGRGMSPKTTKPKITAQTMIEYW